MHKLHKKKNCSWGHGLQKKGNKYMIHSNKKFVEENTLCLQIIALEAIEKELLTHEE